MNSYKIIIIYAIATFAQQVWHTKVKTNRVAQQVWHTKVKTNRDVQFHYL